MHGRALSWDVGFGPRTRAFLLTPAEHNGVLPGLLALHCHGGVRSTGAEQLVGTGLAPHPSAAALRGSVYAGLPVANDLARAGFAVLAHDAFSWGSRAFDLSAPSPRLAAQVDALEALWRERGGAPSDEERFDAISALHEDHLAKALGVLGSTPAGMVATDDLAALEVLAALPEVDPARLGAFGLSGGGGRAVVLSALDERVRASVVACMMATSASLLPDHLDAHSWLLHSPGLAAWRDWPDIAAMTDGRMLVLYGQRDPLFPPAGMAAADRRLASLLGARYTGIHYDAGHEWSAPMQADAAAWLADALAVRQ
ncbi:acetylxylan esterase [Microbacterium hominis]|uniref:acetylxylan esterase n=1 Tax=Microbacterium hominis TaxID=162426 RepID=UPI0020B6E76C|nr:acetylxylan esterase [Microbacterium hominis]